MFSELVLAIWSFMGLAWWIIAWRLVATNRDEEASVSGPQPEKSLSVFKPLPPLGVTGLETIAAGLESFIAQLDSAAEMLLGIHQADRAATAPFLKRMQKKYPQARLKVVFRSEPDEMPNPKIAWQKILAAQAEGELWLWSDADILAPPGFLRAARTDFARGGASMLTFPYVVREIPSAPALSGALFVNADFYPGILLLRRFGSVDFGLGAAMLFRRDDFLDRVDWKEIGAELADDFFLGQKLRPVRVGKVTLATRVDESGWKQALLHDLRWTKTIFWNRPFGSAARILVLPVLGWFGWSVLHPLQPGGWLGLFGMMQIDVLFAVLISDLVGCRLAWSHLPALEAWSLWRSLLWVLAWFPGPVVWTGKKWSGPRTSFSHGQAVP